VGRQGPSNPGFATPEAAYPFETSCLSGLGRERPSALALDRPDLIEQALLQEVERCERGELSVEECAAIADKLADAAKQHLRRAQELAEIARKVRPPGWNPPHAPR
jgi:hypothetical protein